MIGNGSRRSLLNKASQIRSTVSSSLWEVCAIVTERLLLLPVTRDDAQCIVDLRSDPFNREQFWAERGPTLEEQLGWSDSPRVGRVDYTVRRIGVRKPLGTVSLASYDSARNSAEIGVVLGENHRGQGIGVEAVRAWVRYGFEILRLDTLDAYIREGNRSSEKLFRSLDFVGDEPSSSRLHPTRGSFRKFVLMRGEMQEGHSNEMTYISFQVADKLMGRNHA